MESNLYQRTIKRQKRAIRVRKHLQGSSIKPRMTVMKSNQHIAVQLIDDEKGFTLASASTLMKELRKKNLGKNRQAAREIGLKIAELARSKQITTCIFDRGRYKFHGVIAEVANAAREAGLQF